jgi:hypothetical protein
MDRKQKELFIMLLLKKEELIEDCKEAGVSPNTIKGTNYFDIR